MTKSQQFPVSTAHNPIRISSKSNQKSEGENGEIPRERERELASFAIIITITLRNIT